MTQNDATVSRYFYTLWRLPQDFIGMNQSATSFFDNTGFFGVIPSIFFRLTLEFRRLRASKTSYKPKPTPLAQIASRTAAVASRLERFVIRLLPLDVTLPNQTLHSFL
jgi:hypothetical protein